MGLFIAGRARRSVWLNLCRLAMFVLLLTLLSPSTEAQASSIEFVGAYSFTFTRATTTATFNVAKLLNTSTTSTSGPLQLELWLTTAPYTGGTLSGYRAAIYKYTQGSDDGTLPPRYYYSTVKTVTNTSSPPNGTYYATLVAGEYTSTCTSSDHYCIAAYKTFPNPVVLSAAGGTVSGSSTDTASVAGLRVGAVFSTSQADSQSFLRFYNTGATAGTVTVTLSNYITGASLGQWTSPSIPAGAAPQYSLGTIESGLGQGFTKPQYYSVAVQSGITGYLQHVLWRPNQGTFTNLSTCNTGVTTNADKLNNVHASTIDYGYPSSVIVHNTGAVAETVSLGIYGASDGARLGTYTTASIPAGGQVTVPMRTMETAAVITPGSAGNHYVVKAEGTFTGFLQHLVENVQADVTTDMTTVCSLNGASPTPATSPLKIGAAFSTAQSNSQSFLRFYNTGTTAGTVTVTLSNYATGASLGQWTSPSIPAGAAPQYSLGTIESGLTAGVAKPQYYSVAVQSGITGYLQHVLWRPNQGTFTNLSTCNAGVTTNADKLNNVHASTIDYGYPSSVIVNNTGTVAQTVTLGIYGASDGVRLGTYTTASIPAGGQVIVPMRSMETAAVITPGSAGNHYVVKAEGAFTGFLQHRVENSQVDVTTDMTTVCALALASTSGSTTFYGLSITTAGTGTGTVTANPSGQVSDTGTNYPAGTNVELTASAGAGSVFSGWSGACSGTAATCQVAMVTNQAVVATFNLVQSPPGNGGTSQITGFAGPYRTSPQIYNKYYIIVHPLLENISVTCRWETGGGSLGAAAPPGSVAQASGTVVTKTVTSGADGVATCTDPTVESWSDYATGIDITITGTSHTIHFTSYYDNYH